jgi:IS30 family transposase
MLDKVSKNRQSRSQGELSGTSRLKEHEVIEIRKIHNIGELNVVGIAKLFNVSHQQISKILKRQRWKHI